MTGPRTPDTAPALIAWSGVVLAWLSLPCAIAQPVADADTRAVLLLLSSHEADPWTLSVTRGMTSTLDAAGLRYSLWVESLDSRRNRGRGYFEDLLRIYRRKLATAHFDVVITAGDEALEFALAYRDDLVRGVPLVFTGVSRVDAATLASSSDVTGVREAIDFAPTLDAALRLHPETETLVLLTPGLAGRHLVEPLVSEYRPDLQLEIWSDERLDAVLERLDTLAGATILVPVGEPRLPNGRKLEKDEFVRTLAASTDTPIYSIWDVMLGQGIVGGELISGARAGAAAAQLAVRVLAGERADAIPLLTRSAGEFRFDYRQLVRYGLSESDLPEGAVVAYRPVSFYEAHRDVLLGASAIIAALAALVGVLLRAVAVRRRAERALRESEARFRDFMDNSPTAIALIGLDRRLALANPMFEAVMGVSRDSLRGRRTGDAFDADFAAEAEAQDAEVLASGASVSRELVHEARGERRDLLSVKFPVRDGAANVVGVGWIAVDVTDLKRAERSLREREQRFREFAERELAKARERLVRQTRLSAIGQMAASLAHDIRNPLGAIRNAAYFLRRRVPANEAKWADYLDLIEREVVASDRIISHMMDVVRERTLDRAVIDLDTVLGAVRRRFDGDDGIRVEIDLDPRPFELFADGAQLERVLDNLLANAAQAMQGRGRITVRARCDGRSDIITVTDEGGGVPAEVVDHLFEPLVTTKPKGTGLGLAICEQIVRQHDGRIGYARAAGGGAEFRIELPAARATAAAV